MWIIIGPHIDSLDNLDENILIAYDFKLNEEKEDLIYINPMFGEGYKENPFKSAERYYPVEMPYAIDETYIFSMIVPDGYVVDELPKSVIVKLNEEGDGKFEYRVSAIQWHHFDAITDTIEKNLLSTRRI